MLNVRENFYLFYQSVLIACIPCRSGNTPTKFLGAMQKNLIQKIYPFYLQIHLVQSVAAKTYP